MKTWTWRGGDLTEGIEMTTDEKLGQVVFLGEAGRGRRYEKVAIGRHRPAKVVDGRVFETHPVKITLPERNGKHEFTFFVLEKEQEKEEKVLVRVRTLTSYVRNASGRHVTIEGEPETLISGYGAFGDAGRVGSWTDGLVVMSPGDVLRVYPSRGQYSYALWLEDGEPTTAIWKDYNNLMAVEKAEAIMAEAEANPETLDLTYGQMPVYTWKGGKLEKGIKTVSGATGTVVALGEEGRGRSLKEVPLVGTDSLVSSVAVVKLDEKELKNSWGELTGEKKVIYGLTQSEKTEDAFLVRVCTGYGYTRRGNGSWKTWKGNPELLASGHGADGDAGGIGSWDDGLFVLREGDVLWACPSGGNSASAIYVHGNQIRCQDWSEWKLIDAQSEPEFYVDKGTAPMGHVPGEWIKQIVTVRDYTGELVRIESGSVVLNLGWDGRDYHEITVRGQWIRLEKDKKVRRIKGEELEKRQQSRTEADELHSKVVEATKQSHVQLMTSTYLCDQVRELSQGQSFDTMPIEGRESINSWIEKAKSILEGLDKVTEELKTLETRQNSGEILVNFEVWHRRGGMSRNGDGWVIQPDGSLRDRDSDDVRRHKSDGTYHWDLVSEDELALKWSCGTMRDVAGSSTFEIAKAPVNGCISAQLETVARIEDEIGAPRNAFGLHAEMQEIFDTRMEAIRRACRKSKVLQSVPKNLDYLTVSGEWGQGIELNSINDFVDRSGDFSESCENRSAQLVDSQSAGDGKLEFLVYDKWGDINLNIRWRELRKGESAEDAEPEPEVIIPPEERIAPTANSMAELLAKFGK